MKAANPRKTVSNISMAQKTANSFKTLTLSNFEVSQSNFMKTNQKSNLGKYDKKQTEKNWMAQMSQLVEQDFDAIMTDLETKKITIQEL